MNSIKIINYTNDLGKYSLPEGVEAVLCGLSIEDQLKYFRVEVESDSCTIEPKTLENAYSVTGIIVDNDIIVGVMMSDDCCISRPCYIGKCVCTWDSSDNNGSGYKSRTDFSYLVFLPDID